MVYGSSAIRLSDSAGDVNATLNLLASPAMSARSLIGR